MDPFGRNSYSFYSPALNVCSIPQFEQYRECPEDIIQEQRSKKQRIGHAPSYVRSAIAPYLHRIEIKPANITPVAGSRDDTIGLRNSLKEAMGELEMVVQKIQHISKQAERFPPNFDRKYRHNYSEERSPNWHLIQSKLAEFSKIVNLELDNLFDKGPSGKAKILSTTTVDYGKRRQPCHINPSFDEEYESGREKRKRSRRIISLKRPSESMEIDFEK